MRHCVPGVFLTLPAEGAVVSSALFPLGALVFLRILFLLIPDIVLRL